MKRMNERKWMVGAAFGILAASTWMWEYSKFLDDHGIFYYLSGDYGVYLLTISVLVILGIALKGIFGDEDDLE